MLPDVAMSPLPGPVREGVEMDVLVAHGKGMLICVHMINYIVSCLPMCGVGVLMVECGRRCRGGDGERC